MFASALQKRKAVVLSQSHPQSQSLTQPQTQPATAQPREATVAASSNSSNGGGVKAATATAGWSLSELLTKKQRTEATQESSGSPSAKNYQSGGNSGEQQMQRPKLAAVARTSSLQAKAHTKGKVQAKGKVQQRQQSDDQEGVVFELSSKRRVTVRKWRSAVLIDIREFYDDNGVSKPGKKGISLSMDQWRSFQRLRSHINEAVAIVEDNNVDEHSLQEVEERISADSKERTIAFTLSSKRRISVRFFRAAVLIDLREFYDQDGMSKPGKKGISLSKEQWESLCEVQEEVSEAASQL
ncbi:hypothetical protein Gpo141_00001374 [Globisporangium polare]